MAQIIQFNNVGDDCINVATIQRNCRMLKAGLIAPAVEDTSRVIAEEHAADPIRDMQDIFRIKEYLISQKRYRDNMLFIVGINFGLRVSDLLVLRFADLINTDCSFKDSFAILEKKTSNTRRNKKNRYISINTAVVEAVTLYLENTPGTRLSDYLFRSESNRGSNLNRPLNRKSVDRILKGVASDLGMDLHMSTHTLRKTFGLHQMVMSGNDPRKLLLLQKIFGHSTSAMTLEYIGITSDEIEDAYRRMNLGSKEFNYLVDTRVYERDAVTAKAVASHPPGLNYLRCTQLEN